MRWIADHASPSFQKVHRLHQHLATLAIFGRYGVSARGKDPQVGHAGVAVKVRRVGIGNQHGYSSRRQSSANQLFTSSG